MFAALLLNALAADPPASIPDRWLLKLAPAELPESPAALFTATWADRYFPRNVDGAWSEWTTFRRATPGAPGEATVTRTEGFATPARPLTPTVRVVPFAAHGRLVEYDRKLYTATT